MFPTGEPTLVKGTDSVTGTATLRCGTSRLRGIPYFCCYGDRVNSGVYRTFVAMEIELTQGYTVLLLLWR